MLNKVKEIIKVHNGTFSELLKEIKRECPESLYFWDALIEINMAKSNLQAFGDDKVYFGEVFNLRDDFSRETIKNKEEFEFFTKLRKSIVKHIDDTYDEDFIETAKDEGLDWDIKPKDAIMCHLSKKLKDTNLNTYKEQVQKMEEEIKEKVIAMIKDKMGEKAPYKKEWI